MKGRLTHADELRVLVRYGAGRQAWLEVGGAIGDSTGRGAKVIAIDWKRQSGVRQGLCRFGDHK